LLGPGVSLGLHSAEIEARRGEFTGAVMMRGYDRVASRFTPDSALRMPGIPVGLADREEIRAGVSGTANRKLHHPVTPGHLHRTRE
jgi:hypothetical protein